MEQGQALHAADGQTRALDRLQECCCSKAHTGKSPPLLSNMQMLTCCKAAWPLACTSHQGQAPTHQGKLCKAWLCPEPASKNSHKDCIVVPSQACNQAHSGIKLSACVRQSCTGRHHQQGAMQGASDHGNCLPTWAWQQWRQSGCCPGKLRSSTTVDIQ